jgi:hypothetical protein
MPKQDNGHLATSVRVQPNQYRGTGFESYCFGHRLFEFDYPGRSLLGSLRLDAKQQQDFQRNVRRTTSQPFRFSHLGGELGRNLG